MSLDASDIVESLIDEQARRNAAFQSQGDIDNLVTDVITTYPAETVGMTETVTTATTGTPHRWDDGQTPWNFWSWNT